MTTPYRVVNKGKVTDEILHTDASQEQELIAQSTTPLDSSGKLKESRSCAGRWPGGIQRAAGRGRPDGRLAEQIWSVATAMIPFLERDDMAALMGSNMQRQAVPLLKTDPLIGTGMERRAALDTGDVLIETPARSSSSTRSGSPSPPTTAAATSTTCEIAALNQGTLIHQKPLIASGQNVEAGEVLADGSASDKGEMAWQEPAGRLHVLGGYNFEDAIILSERLVKDDELTSIHIEEYEVDARTTKLGDESATSEPLRGVAAQPRRPRHRPIGAEVQSGDLLVGKVTPKGETELTAEEKLIRAIFKEKAREVPDTSLKVPHGEGGVVIDVKTFSSARRGRRACRRA